LIAQDLRSSYRRPEDIDLFNMLTGESPDTFNVGRIVLARVLYIRYRKANAAGGYGNRDGEQADAATKNPIRNEENGLWSCPHCRRKNFASSSDVWSHIDDGGESYIRVTLCRGVL